MNYQERIQNTLTKIEKINKRIEKHEKAKSRDAYIKYYKDCLWFTNSDSGYQGWVEDKEYEIKRAKKDLEEAQQLLIKYQQLLTAEQDKEATLNDLPETVINFMNDLIERWNRYDFWKREQITKIYEDETLSYKDRNLKLHEKFGHGWYDFYLSSDEQIKSQNEKDAKQLILNMINRVIELTGKITDTKYLSIDSDNQGYSILNGIIIGEKGKARIESIGAGGYNIQKYHIRVLVKAYL